MFFLFLKYVLQHKTDGFFDFYFEFSWIVRKFAAQKDHNGHFIVINTNKTIMKHSIFTTLLIAVSFASCTNQETQILESGSMPVSFRISASDLTRAETSSINDLTDIWIFDEVDGTIVKTLHQTREDADWSNPTLSLPYGTHELYFVASAGTGASISSESITWDKVRDTFSRSLTINVSAETHKTMPVTLSRVATRLYLTIKDPIPDDATSVRVTILNGCKSIGILEPSEYVTTVSNFSVLPEDIGKTNIRYTIWLIAPESEEWQTDINVAVINGDNIIYDRDIHNVLLLRNRTTSISGFINSCSQSPILVLTLTGCLRSPTIFNNSEFQLTEEAVVMTASFYFNLSYIRS